MDELVNRYRLLLESHYKPFELCHPYVFENYLLNYVFGTLFLTAASHPIRKY